MATIISATDVHKTLLGQHVLRGASLEIEQGEAIALIGPSGTGKTVLMKHFVGLMQPDKGRVIVRGEDMSRLRGRKLEAQRSHFGFLFQGGALFQSLSVYDNVAFPLREKTRMKEPEIRERVTAELKRLGLAGSEEKYPAEISGGMAKRVALARALVRSPEILLFDEPTTGLDPIIVLAIHDLINTVRRELGLTAVIVTHEIPSVFAVVDRVAMLDGGVVRTVGTPDELLASDDPAVRKFLQSSMPPERYRMPETKSSPTDSGE